uniref:DM domain-containing protein n=1 Tax=Panagrolaimus sp. ES5 TaxID=591445 RepID=A0AC34GPM7_9BILA
MDSAEFDEIEYKNVLPALTSYKDYDPNERDDEGYDDEEYDRDQNTFRSNKGRLLYCRKCEGHGIQILLKGHTALCPYSQLASATSQVANNFSALSLGSMAGEIFEVVI